MIDELIENEAGLLLLLLLLLLSLRRGGEARLGRTLPALARYGERRLAAGRGGPRAMW